MDEGYDPIEQEHVRAVYDLIRQKQKEWQAVQGTRIALDYRVRLATEEVTFILHNNTRDTIWMTSYLVRPEAAP